MNRYTAVALGLALMLPGLALRGDDYGKANPGDTTSSTASPASGADQTGDRDVVNPSGEGTPARDGANNMDAEGPNGTEIQNAAPDAGEPATNNQAAPDQNGNAQVQPQTGTETAPSVSVTERENLVATDKIYTPLQDFVSHQAHEVGELSQQIDFFRGAGNPDAVMTLYHMIRDHVLVKDAAQNVLARRGDVARPVTLLAEQPMPDTAQDLIRHDITMHEQALASTQQALQNANSDEERNIYQHAVNATQKHLAWLHKLDQGQQVGLGFFGPTTPLSRIAGYRQEIGARRTTSRTHRTHRMHRMRRMRYRR